MPWWAGAERGVRVSKDLEMEKKHEVLEISLESQEEISTLSNLDKFLVDEEVEKKRLEEKDALDITLEEVRREAEVLEPEGTIPAVEAEEVQQRHQAVKKPGFKERQKIASEKKAVKKLTKYGNAVTTLPLSRTIKARQKDVAARQKAIKAIAGELTRDQMAIVEALAPELSKKPTAAEIERVKALAKKVTRPDSHDPSLMAETIDRLRELGVTRDGVGNIDEAAVRMDPARALALRDTLRAAKLLNQGIFAQMVDKQKLTGEVEYINKALEMLGPLDTLIKITFSEAGLTDEGKGISGLAPQEARAELLRMQEDKLRDIRVEMAGRDDDAVMCKEIRAAFKPKGDFTMTFEQTARLAQWANRKFRDISAGVQAGDMTKMLMDMRWRDEPSLEKQILGELCRISVVAPQDGVTMKDRYEPLVQGKRSSCVRINYKLGGGGLTLQQVFVPEGVEMPYTKEVEVNGQKRRVLLEVPEGQTETEAQQQRRTQLEGDAKSQVKQELSTFTVAHLGLMEQTIEENVGAIIYMQQTAELLAQTQGPFRDRVQKPHVMAAVVLSDMNLRGYSGGMLTALSTLGYSDYYGATNGIFNPMLIAVQDLSVTEEVDGETVDLEMTEENRDAYAEALAAKMAESRTYYAKEGADPKVEESLYTAAEWLPITQKLIDLLIKTRGILEGD